MLNELNIIRIIICTVILSYSCFTDIKTRRAPNQLWYILGGIGIFLDAIEFRARDYNLDFLIMLAIGAVFIYIFVYFIFRIGGFGGADAKSLIAIALMFPVYPMVMLPGLVLPVSEGIKSPIFALSVLGNAVVLTLIVPISVLLRNLFTVPFSELMSNPVGAITGSMMRIEEIKGKHLRLMHRYEEKDGNVKRIFRFNGSEVDDELYSSLMKWKREGKIGERVWITPKLPFLIPITLGFLTAVVYGDILMQIIAMFLRPR